MIIVTGLVDLPISGQRWSVVGVGLLVDAVGDSTPGNGCTREAFGTEETRFDPEVVTGFNLYLFIRWFGRVFARERRCFTCAFNCIFGLGTDLGGFILPDLFSRNTYLHVVIKGFCRF